jgi:hypothetical protein
MSRVCHACVANLASYFSSEEPVAEPRLEPFWQDGALLLAGWRDCVAAAWQDGAIVWLLSCCRSPRPTK